MLLVSRQNGVLQKSHSTLLRLRNIVDENPLIGVGTLNSQASSLTTPTWWGQFIYPATPTRGRLQTGMK